MRRLNFVDVSERRILREIVFHLGLKLVPADVVPIPDGAKGVLSAKIVQTPIEITFCKFVEWRVRLNFLCQ